MHALLGANINVSLSTLFINHEITFGEGLGDETSTRGGLTNLGVRRANMTRPRVRGMLTDEVYMQSSLP